jgi:Cft2 family RNA processing exonuclease
VKAYLEERAIFPEFYSAPKGWYSTHYVARLSRELLEDTLRQMHVYYEKLLRKYPDAVTVKDVVTPLTTVHSWCSRGSLKAFQK